MEKFKKNDKVAIIGSWDGKGTVSIRRVVVHSWGAKIAKFADTITGEMVKYQVWVDRPTYGSRIVADASDAELFAIALELAEVVLADRRAHYANCLSRGHGEGYNRAIQKDLDALHEPRAEFHHVLYQEVVDQVRNAR